MKILLVAIHTEPSPQAVPLANGFLKAYAGDTGCELTLQNLFVNTPPDIAASGLAASKPGAIGFSVYSWNREDCRQIALALKKLLPQIAIFAGGPEATADYTGMLTGGGYDFLVVGEGESPFRAVCQSLAQGKMPYGLPGIASIENNRITHTPGEPLAELDTIPSPYLSGLLDCRDYQGVLWQIARGCPFACHFCFDTSGKAGVRRFSMKRVEAELRHFAANGVTQAFVLDSTFNQDKARAKAILRLIRRLAPQIHFHFEVRSEFIDQELADLFSSITCSLQIGLQSADPKVLKGIGRGFNRQDFMAKVGLLNNSGAVFGFDLIFGLPGDSLPRFRESLDFSLALYPNHLDIFPLAVLPGTQLAARAEAIGLKHQQTPPYRLLSAPGFSEDDMTAAGSLGNACDIFYSRGKAVAWFNGTIASLGLKPSDFLEGFATWLEDQPDIAKSETALSDQDVWQLQRGYLKHAFSREELQELLPLAFDLADYHYHYAAALLSPPPRLPAPKQLARLNPLEQRLRLSTSARLASFTYEIMDILEAGEPNLKQWHRKMRPAGSWAVIYPHPEGVFTESVAKPYYQLLKQLDGTRKAGQITSTLRIPEQEARDFLLFALQEGIVTPLSS